MKKYVMLLAFTLIATAGITIAGVFFRNSIVEVSVVKVQPLTVENAVTCSGRVEYAKTTSVFVQKASLVKNVYAKIGDQVKVGQPLLSIATTQNNSSDSSTPQQTYENFINGYEQSSTVSSSDPTSAIKEEDITAPIAGEITSISVEPEGYAYPSTAVMTISSNSDLQIRLSVNESQVSDIKVGQKATITGVGFKNSSYYGTVKSISSGAKQVTTTNGQDTVIDVIVSVEKPNADIKPGFTAKAKIITSESSNVLVAPYEAVRADNNGNEYVFKLNGKQAVKVPITTNREFDNGFEIKSGLNKNDKIVLNPDNLANGSFVIPSVKGTVQSHD